MGKEVKPDLKHMEKEIRALENEIKQMKVKIESDYEKYNDMRNNIANASKGKYDQFEHASLMDFGQIDETDDLDEEIQLMRENKKSDLLNKSIDVRKSVQNLNASYNQDKPKTKFEDMKDRISQIGEQEGLAQVIPTKVALSQLTSSLEISLYGTNSIYTVNLEDASPLEIEFFEKILCFLEGRNVYNPIKLTQGKQNLKRMRFIKMTKDLKYLLIMNMNQYNKMKNNTLNEFEQLEKSKISEAQSVGDRSYLKGVKSKYADVDPFKNVSSLRMYEQKISIVDLVKLVIPELTRDIVRIQKDIKSTVGGDDLITHKDSKFGKFVHKSKIYSETQLIKMAQDATEYPFTIVFKDFELNIVATSYADYRDITKCILCLLNQNQNSSPNQPTSGLKNMLRKQSKRISVDYK